MPSTPHPARTPLQSRTPMPAPSPFPMRTPQGKRSAETPSTQRKQRMRHNIPHRLYHMLPFLSYSTNCFYLFSFSLTVKIDLNDSKTDEVIQARLKLCFYRWQSSLQMQAGRCAGCLGSIPFARNAARCQECGVTAHNKVLVYNT